MNTTEKNSGSSCWSSYWAAGALTSLPEDFAANYDGEIAAYWRRQVEGLRDGAIVLDLCTGNGAVALLLAEAAREAGKSVDITGVDAAEISTDIIRQGFPAWAALLDEVRLVSGQSLETLSTDSDSVDLIASQYGIEYCDWPMAARQCARLLKPHGRLCIIAHSVTTDLLATMRAEHAEFAYLESLGLMRTVRELLDGRMDWAVFTEWLQGFLATLTAQRDWRQSGLYQYAASLASGLLQMTEPQFRARRDSVETAQLQLQHGQERLAQMLKVNQALHDHPDWTRVFIEAGLVRTGSGEVIYQGRHKVGDWFEFEKPG